ncbi:hypothetical protein UYSO10_5377 [Kosakonia radicincitans]|nr:hypothetical protein UYSO10_5377 [Kosakonia radicincitans]
MAAWPRKNIGIKMRAGSQNPLFSAVKNSNSAADGLVKNDNSREFISYVKFLS